jgi:hypothetical protein
MSTNPGPMQDFSTGATRSSDVGKLDPEGFLSPRVVERYCQYLHKHRTDAAGRTRASDNWQGGMPRARYVKSLLRHVLAVWLLHREEPCEAEMDDSLCAIIFNAMGLLHERLHGRNITD